MTKPLLSILIPTTPEREVEVSRLMEVINQYDNHEHLDVRKEENYIQLRHYSPYSEIEVVIIGDNKEMTIGEKRELLYKAALGFFSWQIDSDDLISDDAIQLILEAIKSNPGVDVISFEEYVNIDGREYRSNHSNTYHDWDGDGCSLLSDGFHFHRTIFFKDVIRTELAKSVPVPKLRWAEDHEYAKLLKPLIKSEVHISEQLYRYIHVSSNYEERYGFNTEQASNS